MKRTLAILLANPLSLTGVVLVAVVVICAVFADFIAPFPEHAGAVVDFANFNKAPEWPYIMGTDLVGRDIFSRILYAYRVSLILGVVVLAIAAPIGVTIGLVAGYMGGWTEYALMRITDVFLSIPPLVLAMSIMGVLEPTLTNGMLAVTAMWWPWYTRLVYNITRAEREEGYVLAAEVIGASPLHIMFREILPNCVPAIVTKMTLDLGFVILIASSLSFLGLGVQPPTPSWGALIRDGTRYLLIAPHVVLMPGLALLSLVVAINLLGDRLRMETSAEDDGVFVRSLSNRGQFGGLSAEVWPMSVVMLAGFDIVLIETVGVGQREVDVSRLCDTTCYVAQPGSGDSVQFLKAGILEVPHILVVNKADMGAVATRTLSELSSALKRTHPDGDWQVPVLATSAASDDGVEALADALEQHYQLLLSQQRLSQRRRHYQSYWLHKRLLEEFGSFGIERLGGEQQLLAQIESQPMNLYHQYQTLRQRLYTAFHDINS